MSWDLFVQDWGDVNSLDEIPNDFKPNPIGTRSDFIARIQKVEPSVDFTDPSSGKFRNNHFSIRFDMGDSEELYGFSMRVRGDDHSLPFIAQILDELNVRASDGTTAHFFDTEEYKKNLGNWISLRNKVINHDQQDLRPKMKPSNFVFSSIILQIISIPIVYGFFESILSIITNSSFSLEFYFLSFPIVNYTILASIIIVTSVQETTKSELFATVMNAVWIIFILSETSDAFRNRPYEYILFVLSIALTIPIRIFFRKRFHSSP